MDLDSRREIEQAEPSAYQERCPHQRHAERESDNDKRGGSHDRLADALVRSCLRSVLVTRRAFAESNGSVPELRRPGVIVKNSRSRSVNGASASETRFSWR